jgi:hypothetical protein
MLALCAFLLLSWCLPGICKVPRASMHDLCMHWAFDVSFVAGRWRMFRVSAGSGVHHCRKSAVPATRKHFSFANNTPFPQPVPVAIIAQYSYSRPHRFHENMQLRFCHVRVCAIGRDMACFVSAKMVCINVSQCLRPPPRAHHCHNQCIFAIQLPSIAPPQCTTCARGEPPQRP